MCTMHVHINNFTKVLNILYLAYIFRDKFNLLWVILVCNDSVFIFCNEIALFGLVFLPLYSVSFWILMINLVCFAFFWFVMPHFSF